MTPPVLPGSGGASTSAGVGVPGRCDVGVGSSRRWQPMLCQVEAIVRQEFTTPVHVVETDALPEFDCEGGVVLFEAVAPAICDVSLRLRVRWMYPLSAVLRAQALRGWLGLHVTHAATLSLAHRVALVAVSSFRDEIDSLSLESGPVRVLYIAHSVPLLDLPQPQPSAWPPAPPPPPAAYYVLGEWAPGCEVHRHVSSGSRRSSSSISSSSDNSFSSLPERVDLGLGVDKCAGVGVKAFGEAAAYLALELHVDRQLSARSLRAPRTFLGLTRSRSPTMKVARNLRVARRWPPPQRALLVSPNSRCCRAAAPKWASFQV